MPPPTATIFLVSSEGGVEVEPRVNDALRARGTRGASVGQLLRRTVDALVEIAAFLVGSFTRDSFRFKSSERPALLPHGDTRCRQSVQPTAGGSDSSFWNGYIKMVRSVRQDVKLSF